MSGQLTPSLDESRSMRSDDGRSCDGSLTNKDSSELPFVNGIIQHIPLDHNLYKVHKAVYENDFKTFTSLLRQKDTDLTRKDMHGNTALHIATMLGRKEFIQLLLAHDSPVSCKNSQGQTPLNEAISFGDRSIIVTILNRLRKQTQTAVEDQQPHVEEALTKLNDFEMILKWEFHSWVPLVSRFLPSDICHIYKKGCQIRMDTTLVDFKEMKWERGDLTFLFDGKKLGSQSLLVMDNQAHVYQWIRDQSEEVLEGDVDIMMSTDNETGKISTSTISFSRAHTGLFFKEDKTEVIGGHTADFYHINGIKLVSVKRREHLSDEDIKRNKSRIDHNNIHKSLGDSFEVEPRQSLPPPPANTVSWSDYWSAPPGKPPCIGRPIKSKNYSKSFQATIAMSQDFPVTIEEIITILESLKPLRHFKKLREFLSTKLPPGFPVKLEIPVFPTVTARVSFERFAWRTDLDLENFQVPKNYVEDPQRFSGL